ncbi:hypothetical protein TNCV_4159081 [Trichonephila clavipes]|nr:hypothetical protein TNCV_4159081 [Trichonephila clavipes]
MDSSSPTPPVFMWSLVLQRHRRSGSLLSFGSNLYPPPSQVSFFRAFFSSSLHPGLSSRLLKKPFKHQGPVHNTPLLSSHWQATKVSFRPRASLVSYLCGTHKHTPGQSGM